MTEVPTWALWVFGALSPLLTGCVAAVGVTLTRRESAATRALTAAADEQERAFQRHSAAMAQITLVTTLLRDPDETVVAMGRDALQALSEQPPDAMEPEDWRLLLALANSALGRQAAGYHEGDRFFVETRAADEPQEA